MTDYQIYAGIGARETPGDVLELMTLIGGKAAQMGYILRSGRAKGADTAFETGCDMAHGSKMIYDPDHSHAHPMYPLWLKEAEKHHPAWGKLHPYHRLLHARNSPIILGDALTMPAGVVVCWTADGKASGGTGQGIRVAKAYGVPVYNLRDSSHRQIWENWVRS